MPPTRDRFAGVPLRGERVVLRDWRREDLPTYESWQRPEHEWHRWDGPYFPRPDATEVARSVEQLRDRIDRSGQRPERPTPSLVVADPDTDELLGLVSWYFESQASDWRRIGIVLFDPRSWSGGRGREALALWAGHLFATTEIGRLDFATWSGHEAMCRIGRSLGWIEEARFRAAREVRGWRYDSVVFGTLREEWEHREGSTARSATTG